MREDLLGYLLGALSADELRRIEEALADDPQLRRELEQLRRSLEPLDALDDDQDPPAGLADRALHAIEQYEELNRPTPRSVFETQSGVLAPSQDDRPAGPSRRYRLSDGIVLALVGLCAITLLLPALANSRFEARKCACQNNLRKIGALLIDDSLRHGDTFMQVPLFGKRAFDGVFASNLLDRQLISLDTSALLCPGVEWRKQFGAWSVPTLEQIDNATGTELDRLQQMAGGSYAYVVGYVDSQGHYRPVRNQSRSYFPILADVPSFHLAGLQSANHGGRGQNIFYEDGHVTFVTELNPHVCDDPWRNRLGHVEAGNGRDDAVLLRSEWPPIAPVARVPRATHQ